MDGIVSVLYVGGPTALVELGGLRLLVDPTFDPPGEYPVGERRLRKTMGPALEPEQLGPVDAVLLSHDQHPDNLDRRGRELLRSAGRVFSTRAAHGRLGALVRPLSPWASEELPRPDGGVLHVTGAPALHGPEGSEPLVGEVTGFVLAGEGLVTVYVSGDNASLELVRSIAARIGGCDLALLAAGAAQTKLVQGGFLTLTSDLAAEAARLLAARHVVPLHFEGWTHFTQDAGSLREAFARAGLSDRLHLLRPGERFELTAR